VLVVRVTKADGTKQRFDCAKVVRTCLSMGASPAVAEAIAEKIEAKARDGIESRKILQMIFRQLRHYHPAVTRHIDLRKALSRMKSQPDFERFIRTVLREHGYEVTPNQIIRGKCVEHEVDAVARKDGVTYLVEVKHHFNYHTPTGLDISRIARAVFEDVTEGAKLGLNTFNIDRAMIVCNTKFSEHAELYGQCRGIQQIGWSAPPDQNLRAMITGKKLYPVTYLSGLTAATRRKLASAEIVLLKHLTAANPETLRRKAGISKETLDSIIKSANAIL
jgi:hypothetical protein